MIRTFCFFLSSCSPPTLCRAPSSLWQITQLLQIDRDNDIIFVYIGGGRVPEHLREIITHARIDKSVREIDNNAFDGCPRLLDVEGHDGVERVGTNAFYICPLLRRVNLPCVKVIDESGIRQQAGNNWRWGILGLHLSEAT